MNNPISIARGVLSTILAVAYLLMSVASVTHELSHMSSARGAHAASLALDVKGAHDHDLPLSDAKSGFCFFCSYSPTVLMFVALAISFVVRVARTPRSFALPARRTISPILSVVGLRAPPALG